MFSAKALIFWDKYKSHNYVNNKIKEIHPLSFFLNLTEFYAEDEK